MNTKIYVQNPNEKNYRLSLELGGLHYVRINERVHNVMTYLTTPTSVVHSTHAHPPATNSMLEPFSSKISSKKEKFSTQPLSISQEKASGTLF